MADLFTFLIQFRICFLCLLSTWLNSFTGFSFFFQIRAHEHIAQISFVRTYVPCMFTFVETGFRELAMLYN